MVEGGEKTSSRRRSISEIKLGPEFTGAATAVFVAALAKVAALHPRPDDDDPLTGGGINIVTACPHVYAFIPRIHRITKTVLI